MKIAAVTMVHNELEFTKLWVRHYSEICGKENLFIFSHGGHDQIAEICEGCNVMFVPRDAISADFDAIRWAMMASWIKVLHESYDAVFVGDIDEYCFVDPEYGSMVEFLERYKGQRKALNCFCLDVFPDHGEGNLDFSNPVFSQRRKAMVNGSYCKPLISLERIQVYPGAHSCDQEPFVPDGLYMAHLKYASLDIAEKGAEMRQQMTADNGGVDKFRKSLHTSWLRGMPYMRRTIVQQRRKPSVSLDDNIAALRNELTQSIGTHPRRKGKLFRALPIGDTILEVPERFARAF